MAELAYGSGSRLTELLRLRVKDQDLDRQQVVARVLEIEVDEIHARPGVS